MTAKKPYITETNFEYAMTSYKQDYRILIANPTDAPPVDAMPLFMH